MIKLGYKLRVVSDGRTALASLENRAGPRMAILDSCMPDIDGFEVCRRIKETAGSRVSIILMTRENDRTEVLKALEAGADDYLQKPFDGTELQARLQIMAKRAYELQRAMELIPKGASADSKSALSDDNYDEDEEALEPRKIFTEKHKELNELKAFNEFEILMTKVFADMGLGKAKLMKGDDSLINTEFSILSVVVVPKKNAWVDILLEMDGPSAQALFKKMTGGTEESRDELVDMAGEALNIIQGGLKNALQNGFLDVITPVIPFRVSPDKREKFADISTEFSQHVFALEDMKLKVTLFPHYSSVVTKSLDDLRIRDVSTETVNLPGSPKLLLLNKGIMVTDNHIRRLREMTGCGFIKVKFDMVGPSEISTCAVKV